MQVSSRYGVSYPDPVRDDRPDIPLHLKNIVDGLERSAMYGQGTFALRPVSTGGSPGIQGRFYMATDSNPHVLYYDYGTGWDTVGFLAAGSVGTTQLADDSITGGALGAGVKLKQNTITSDNIAGSAVRGGGHEIAAATITAADIAAGLKPSGGAGAATEALRALGTAAGTAAAGIHHAQHAAAGADPLPWTTIIGSGNLAALPAAAATNAGYLFFVTNVGGGTLYRSDGANWNKVSAGLTELLPGGTIDYKTFVAPKSVTASTEGAANTIVASNSVAYDGTEVEINFEATGTVLDSGVANYLILVYLRDATVLGQSLHRLSGADPATLRTTLYDTPSAANHVYTVEGFLSAAASQAHVQAGVGGSGALLPGFIRTRKA